MRYARTKAVTAGAILALAWWGISATRAPSAFQEPLREQGEVASPQVLPQAQMSAGPASSALKREPTSVPPKPDLSPSAFEYQKELNEYATLKTKVLPSPEEKTARENLMKDSRFLRGLGERLVKAPLMSLGEQDVAIDALVEALEKGDRSVASAVIAAIVEDKQVEDSKLPTGQREQLAGVKAELLYHWTAIEPEQSSHVARMLPGPVSKKIWANVQEAQRNNLNESAAEANR